jgi:hypothetical protein
MKEKPPPFLGGDIVRNSMREYGINKVGSGYIQPRTEEASAVWRSVDGGKVATRI